MGHLFHLVTTGLLGCAPSPEAAAPADETEAATEPCTFEVVATEICACDEFQLDITALTDQMRADGNPIYWLSYVVYPDGPEEAEKELCAGSYHAANLADGDVRDVDGRLRIPIPTTTWDGLTVQAAATDEYSTVSYHIGYFAPVRSSSVTVAAAE